MRAFIRLHILICLAVVAWSTSAAAIEHRWSAPFGDGADQVATAVAMDDGGGVAVLGHFNGSVDFGGGALVCPGVTDATFLARFGPSGNHRWSRVLGDSLELGTSKLAIDDADNTLVALEFRGSIDAGGGVITATGYRDCVIARYDEAGNHLWSRSFGGPSGFVMVKAAGVDGAGNLIVAGTYTGDIDFGGTTLTYQYFTTNMFVVKFDTDGNHVWSRRHTGGTLEITAVAGDPFGGAVVAGYHASPFDFGGGTLTPELVNVFIARYSPTGDHVWSQSFGAPDTYQYAFDVDTDGVGSVFVTGHFNSALDLGGGFLTSAGGWDIFVAKFSSGGNHQWSHRFGDAGTQRSYSLAVDGDGAVTIAGHFFGTVDFGGGALTADPLDFCVARFDGNGNHVLSRRLDIYNLGMKNDKPYAIAAAANSIGDMAFAGTFSESVDCGGGALASAGSWDAFVVRFSSLATAVSSSPPPAPTLRAFPNPFNPRTTLAFDVKNAGVIRLTIHDVTGRSVRTLIDGRMDAGAGAVQWDGRDGNGRTVPSGVYFARLMRLDGVAAAQMQRLVLLK